MDSLRWPSSHELDLDEVLLTQSASALPTKITRITEYIDKNWERFKLQEVAERNALGKGVKQASEWKERGNEHFKNKRWKDAADSYTQVHQSCSSSISEINFFLPSMILSQY